MSLSAIIGSLRVNLSANTAAFTDGIKKARTSIGGLVSGVGRIAGPIGAMAAGIGAATMKAAEAANEINNLANLAKTGIEDFQKFAAGAKSVGIENDKAADILKDTTEKVGEFIATGGGGMKDFFENVASKVGVTADSFRDLAGPDALQLYMSTMEKAGVSQEEMVFYMESLASDASALIPILSDNGAEMERIGSAAESMGLVSQDQADAAKKFSAAMEKLKGAVRAVGIALIDAGVADLIAEIMTVIAESVAAIPKMVGEIRAAIVDMIAAVVGGAKDFNEFKNNVITTVRQMVEGVTEWLTEGLLAPFKRVREMTEEAAGFFSDLYQRVVGGSYIPDMVIEVEQWLDRLSRSAPATVKTLTDEIADSFAGMAESVITGSKSAGDAIRDLAGQMASAGIRGALLGEGPFASIFAGASTTATTSMAGAASISELLTATFPGFASGTRFAPGGPAIVGEDGPELINLARGSAVHSSRDTADMLGGRFDVRVFVDDDGRFDARVERVSDRLYSRREPATVRAAVGATYRANREVPLR